MLRAPLPSLTAVPMQVISPKLHSATTWPFERKCLSDAALVRRQRGRLKGRLYDNYTNPASRVLLWRWNRLPSVVPGTWWRCIGDYDRQVLLYHLSMAAAFFRIPQPNSVLEI